MKMQINDEREILLSSCWYYIVQVSVNLHITVANLAINAHIYIYIYCASIWPPLPYCSRFVCECIYIVCTYILSVVYYMRCKINI